MPSTRIILVLVLSGCWLIVPTPLLTTPSEETLSCGMKDEEISDPPHRARVIFSTGT